MTSKRKHDDFLADMKSLLDSGKYSDFTITCQGREWKVHKAVVCSQSDIMDAASRFGKEAAENKIDLPDDDPEIVEYMLRFMYEREYRLPSDDLPRPFWIRYYFKLRGELPLKRHWACESALWYDSAEVLKRLRDQFPSIVHASSTHYSIRLQADQVQDHEGKVFDNTLLERPQQSKMNEIIISTWGEQMEKRQRGVPTQNSIPANAGDLIIHAKLYTLADKYFTKGLKERVCERFAECMHDSFGAEMFYEAVKVVFTTTPETDTGLRDLVVQRVSEEKKRYTVQFNLDLQDALKEIPDLAFWVMRYEDKIQYDARKEQES